MHITTFQAPGVASGLPKLADLHSEFDKCGRQSFRIISHDTHRDNVVYDVLPMT
jgi:hypothetical protein